VSTGCAISRVYTKEKVETETGAIVVAIVCYVFIICLLRQADVIYDGAFLAKVPFSKPASIMRSPLTILVVQIMI
jgi:hypothetical protein